jgi:hypothetical protein
MVGSYRRSCGPHLSVSAELTLPAADVEIGHRSISVCHLANIARFVGRKLRWDPVAERFPDDEEANRWVVRVRRKGYELPDVL